MVFLPQGTGIRKLSEIEIDADKDWNDKTISNVLLDADKLKIGGTEVISSNRVLKNIERFEAKRPLSSDPNDILTLPFPVVNAFAFKTIYKAEEYDFETETWTDVTADYDWNLMTDMKGTYITFSMTANVDRRFRIWIDLGSYPHYISAIVFCFIHSGYIKELIVEKSLGGHRKKIPAKHNQPQRY